MPSWVFPRAQNLQHPLHGFVTVPGWVPLGKQTVCPLLHSRLHSLFKSMCVHSMCVCTVCVCAQYVCVQFSLSSACGEWLHPGGRNPLQPLWLLEVFWIHICATRAQKLSGLHHTSDNPKNHQYTDWRDCIDTYTSPVLKLWLWSVVYPSATHLTNAHWRYSPTEASILDGSTCVCMCQCV